MCTIFYKKGYGLSQWEKCYKIGIALCRLQRPTSPYGAHMVNKKRNTLLHPHVSVHPFDQLPLLLNLHDVNDSSCRSSMLDSTSSYLYIEPVPLHATLGNNNAMFFLTEMELVHASPYFYVLASMAATVFQEISKVSLYFY